MKSALIILLFSLYLTGYAERTKNKIYVEIAEGARAACFKRFNATHQIGCTSEPNGNVGVVHFINSTSDIDWLVDHGPHKPYAVLIDAHHFNRENVDRLRSSDKINGIMVIHIEDVENSTLSLTPDYFSPDKSCPNERYSLYSGSENYEGCSSVKWNPYGDGLMFEDFNFPIFILTKEADVKFAIENCYERFNQPDEDGNPRDYPLCAVELKDRMDGAKDSETCIRRTRHQSNLNPDRYCDPMGDQNVYSTVKEINSTTTRPNDSVIIVAARLDGFSMFDQYYPSADNHVTGIVALLAVAEAIGKVKDDIKQDSSKEVMFTFFNGEAWDYIGSSRMVYDMNHGQFPLPLDKHVQTIQLHHIHSFVEVNQLGYRDQGKVWIHTDPLSRPNVSTQIADMIQDLKVLGAGLIDEANASWPLPPASAQMFLKSRGDIPTVVITDHEKQYKNKYYNSRFDLATMIKQSYPDGLNDTEKYDYITEQAENLTQVASVLAKFLYKQATGKNASDNFAVNKITVNQLLYCFLISPKCDLLRSVVDGDQAAALTDKPYPYYVGVDSMTNQVTFLTRRLLLSFLGDIDNTNKSKDTCQVEDAFYRYAWMQGPKNATGQYNPYCIKGMANYSIAVSKAFEMDDYDYSSGHFSTWTESAWAIDAMNVRFFLIPSKKFETVTLAVGVVLLLVSMLLVYFIDARTDVLFAHPGPSRRY